MLVARVSSSFGNRLPARHAPVFARGDAFEVAEASIEVRQVVEPGFGSDLRDAEVVLHQEPARVAHADLRQIAHERLAEMAAEEPGESGGAQSSQIRHLALREVPACVLVDVGEHALGRQRVARRVGDLATGQ